jgi:hypothetical protein
MSRALDIWTEALDVATLPDVTRDAVGEGLDHVIR